MKNIGTKSVNMSDIMVYLAMSSTTIDKILCFMGPKTPRFLAWKASLRLELEKAGESNIGRMDQLFCFNSYHPYEQDNIYISFQS